MAKRLYVALKIKHNEAGIASSVFRHPQRECSNTALCCVVYINKRLCMSRVVGFFVFIYERLYAVAVCISVFSMKNIYY